MSKLQDADLEAGVPAGAVAAGKKAGQQRAPARAEAEKTVAEEEDPRLRLAFVRKVYAILSLQFALTAAVSIAGCLTSAVPRFFTSGPPATDAAGAGPRVDALPALRGHAREAIRIAGLLLAFLEAVRDDDGAPLPEAAVLGLSELDRDSVTA